MYIYISHIFKTLLAKHRLPGVFTATIELGSSLAWVSLLPAFGIERVPSITTAQLPPSCLLRLWSTLNTFQKLL